MLHFVCESVHSVKIKDFKIKIDIIVSFAIIQYVYISIVIYEQLFELDI